MADCPKNPSQRKSKMKGSRSDKSVSEISQVKTNVKKDPRSADGGTATVNKDFKPRTGFPHHDKHFENSSRGRNRSRKEHKSDIFTGGASKTYTPRPESSKSVHYSETAFSLPVSHVSSYMNSSMYSPLPNPAWYSGVCLNKSYSRMYQEDSVSEVQQVNSNVTKEPRSTMNGAVKNGKRDFKSHTVFPHNEKHRQEQKSDVLKGSASKYYIPHPESQPIHYSANTNPPQTIRYVHGTDIYSGFPNPVWNSAVRLNDEFYSRLSQEASLINPQHDASSPRKGRHVSESQDSIEHIHSRSPQKGWFISGSQGAADPMHSGSSRKDWYVSGPRVAADPMNSRSPQKNWYVLGSQGAVEYVDLMSPKKGWHFLGPQGTVEHMPSWSPQKVKHESLNTSFNKTPHPVRPDSSDLAFKPNKSKSVKDVLVENSLENNHTKIVTASEKGKKNKKKTKHTSKKDSVSAVTIVEKQEAMNPPVKGSQSAWQMILNLDDAIKACEEKRGSRTLSYASHFQQQNFWPKLGETKLEQTAVEENAIQEGTSTSKQVLKSNEATSVDSGTGNSDLGKVQRPDNVINVVNSGKKEHHRTNSRAINSGLVKLESAENVISVDHASVNSQSKEQWRTNESINIGDLAVDLGLVKLENADNVISVDSASVNLQSKELEGIDKTTIVDSLAVNLDLVKLETTEKVLGVDSSFMSSHLAGNADLKVASINTSPAHSTGQTSACQVDESVDFKSSVELQTNAVPSVLDEATRLEIRERRKQKQAKKKEEKRRKREEEFRKRLLAPKDQKVTLIDAEMVSKFLGRPVARTHSSIPTNDTAEFPALGIRKRSILVPKQLVKDEVISEVSPAPSSGKHPKRKDPITIDILQAIKTSESKQHQQDSAAERKGDHQHYSGNPLDSDNPERKRGKFRDRPKRPSKLKSLILAERAMKKNAIRAAILQKLPIVRTPRARVATAGDTEPEEEGAEAVNTGNENTESASHCEEEVRIVIPEKEWRQLGKIHSRRFREYCDHSVTPELNAAVEALLKDIVKFHDSLYYRNPVKANARRRHVTGLKEVKKQLGLKKLKLVIIVPDLEKVTTKGGLDDKVQELKDLAAANNVPCVYALSRKKLGNVLYKEVPISCCGIISYEGAENKLKLMLEALARARNHYHRQTNQIKEPAIVKEEVEDEKKEEVEEVDVNKQVVLSLLAKLQEKEPCISSPLLEAIETSAAHSS